MWRWVRVGAGVGAAVLLTWMIVLFGTSSTITFRAYGEYPEFDKECAPVAAYLFASPLASSARDANQIDPVDQYCDRQRTAYAGLIGLLAVPTIALAWVSTRRPQPPSARGVIRAATGQRECRPNPAGHVTGVARWHVSTSQGVLSSAI